MRIQLRMAYNLFQTSELRIRCPKRGRRALRAAPLFSAENQFSTCNVSALSKKYFDAEAFYPTLKTPANGPSAPKTTHFSFISVENLTTVLYCCWNILEKTTRESGFFISGPSSSSDLAITPRARKVSVAQGAYSSLPTGCVLQQPRGASNK
jgi:hypothetical protein